MSKLTDIKDRIMQLDGGAFQNLCDAYLAYRGYGNGYSLGMKTGTNKTAKGSPDTYFLTADKKYIFVMYTTQQEGFEKKAIEDIEKCFSSGDTGVCAKDVAEVIYCHTYGRLTPGEDQRLRRCCEAHGAILTLIGLDELGNDLFRKYPILAKDLLGISVDSGQIMPLEAFVAKHDANKMSAPLNTEFLFRAEEVEKAKTALCENDVLMIAGPAGVGKTRFALELCRQIAEEKDYSVLVIKSNELPLYDDLVATIEVGKNYIVLVDDANELSGLHHVLAYLPKVSESSAHIVKLVLTVRDYARKQVMQNVMEVTRPETIKIGTLKDDDIRKLMEVCYGITNRLYTDRIVNIAEGNARLAMLAGRLAADAESLTAIQDASDLYHSYYSRQLDSLVSSKTGLYSAGIMAFVQSIHLDHLEKLDPAFTLSGITRDTFINDLKLLHEAEIVDLCNDKAARISDQSFSNFLIKYVFVEKRIIPLSLMIETCFSISKSRTVSACNVLLNVFSDQAVRDYVESQVNLVWDRLENNRETFWPFFKAFHMVRPTQTLLLIQEQIKQEPCQPFDVRTLVLKDDGPDKTISDDIIEILGSFENHVELPAALDLLLLYYKKRPDLYEQFYSAFAGRFGVDLDSPRFGYYTQSTVVEHLCAAVNASPDDSNLLSLFVHIAGHFLKLDVSKAEGGRHNTVSFYTLALPPDKPVLEYRKKLLSQIYQIYQRGSMQAEIEHIFDRYGMPHYGVDTNLEVVREEFQIVLNFFSLFQKENLYHCVIAQHIKQVAKRIDYDASDTLLPFLNSDKYQIYSALAQNHPEDFSLGYEQGVQRHKDRVQKLVENYTQQDMDCLIQVCLESIQSFDKEERELGSGLGYVFETIQCQDQLYLYLVESYMKADTPYKISGATILERLFGLMPALEVKSFITKYDYRQQNAWLWYFYALMPERQISHQWAEDLLCYLGSPDIELKSSPFRRMDLLHKYETVEPQIIFKALRIVADHYEESPFIFSLYVFDILNHSRQEDVQEILNKFSGEISLLEDLYLKGISYSSHEDYNGALLLAIISVDVAFLYRYLDYLIEVRENSAFNNYYDTKRLLIIWDTEHFMGLADSVFDYLHRKREQVYWAWGSPLSKMLCNQPKCQENIHKQDRWIAHTIEQHSSDGDRMYELFSSIEELPHERRKKAVETFLSLNTDPVIFDRLPLEPSHWGGSGSMIPYMQERVDYLSSLLPSVSGLKYLRQKQRIEQDIENWKARIRSEEIKELLESWYN